MKNEIPIIGKKKPTCSFCGGSYAEINHPTMGKVMAPTCNCMRPVHLGDLKQLQKNLEALKDKIDGRKLLDVMVSQIDGSAQRERGQ